MANPSSVGVKSSSTTAQVLAQYQPALVATDNAEVAVTLDINKTYTLYHTGLNATGAGGSDTNPIYLSFNTTVAVATTAANANKGVLISGETMEIGPGLNEVSTITSNASYEPVMMIIPHKQTYGMH